MIPVGSALFLAFINYEKFSLCKGELTFFPILSSFSRFFFWGERLVLCVCLAGENKLTRSAASKAKNENILFEKL